MKTNSNPPSLPEQISSDGREIWDWAGKLATWSIRQDKIRELKQGIRDLEPRCGTCQFWMQSCNCPREKNVNGYSRGPSMSGPPCSKHVEDNWTTELREKRKAELNALLAEGGK